MPKPWSDAFGSGAHLNVSLADAGDRRNLFDTADRAASRAHRAATGTTAATATLAYQFTAGRAGARRRRSPRCCLPDGQLLQAAAAPRADARDLLGAGVPGLRLQQPDADVPAADEPALPGAAHRRQRLSTSTSARPSRWPPAWTGSSGELKPGDPVNIDTYTIGDEELRPRRGAPAPGDARRGGRRVRADELACRGVRQRVARRPTPSSGAPSGRSTTPSSASGSASGTCACGERGTMMTSEDQPEQANHEAFARLTGAEPVLVDVPPGRRGDPGHDRRPRSSPRARRCPGRSTTAASAARSCTAPCTRGWPPDSEEADAKLADGRIIRLAATHDHGCVGSVAGIYTASMPVFVVENAARRQPRLLQLLRGRVAAPAELRRLRRRGPAPAWTSSATSWRPVLQDGHPRVRRHPAQAADRPGPAHGRRAAQPQHRRAPAVHPGADPARSRAAPATARRSEALTALRFFFAQRLLLPAAVHGRGQGHGRRGHGTCRAPASSPR